MNCWLIGILSPGPTKRDWAVASYDNMVIVSPLTATELGWLGTPRMMTPSRLRVGGYWHSPTEDEVVTSAPL